MNTDRSPDLPGEDLGAHVMEEDRDLTAATAKKGREMDEGLDLTAGPVERRRPLLGLLVAQFLGSFNDNAWKQIVILLAVASAASEAQGQEPGPVGPIIPMNPPMPRAPPAGGPARP